MPKHPLTVAAEARASVIQDRLCCDLCGSDQAELRIYPLDGWTADDLLCRPCFVGRDPFNTFEDFQLAQGAAQ